MVVKSINCLLADGTTVKIDLSFYKKFKEYNWCCNNYGYVVTKIKVNGKQQTLLLHHYVLDFKYDPNIDLVADHKYGNLRDCRLKNLRLVSHSINVLNQRGGKNNTGFPNIQCYCYGHYYYYRVSYLNIYKMHDERCFPYIKGVNEEDVFFEAFEFFENIKKTLPHYIEAFPEPEEDSSDDESIEEVNFEDKINPNRLQTNNTSKLLNISDYVDGSYWQVTYYNEDGKHTSKRFPYFPKSIDTKDEALTKTLLFQKEYEKYRPKKGKKEKTPIVIINNNIIINNINAVQTKKKKKIPLLKSKKINIERNEGINSSECSDFKFLDKYENLNENIKPKWKIVLMIDGNEYILKKSDSDFKS
jgi:hypothetical protein